LTRNSANDKNDNTQNKNAATGSKIIQATSRSTSKKNEKKKKKGKKEKKYDGKAKQLNLDFVFFFFLLENKTGRSY